MLKDVDVYVGVDVYVDVYVERCGCECVYVCGCG